MFVNVNKDHHILPTNIQNKVSCVVSTIVEAFRNILEDEQPIEKI